jgi:hypothetical protein
MYFETKQFLIMLIILFIVYFIAKSLYKDVKMYPKNIWMFWDTKTLPPIIEKIKKYNEPKLKNWDVRFLNAETVYNYIPKEEFPSGYDKLIPAHKADWIRMYLLYKYGGCWIDCGIIINDKNAIDKIYNQAVSEKAHLVVFKGKFKNKLNNFIHISGTKIPLYIENWFIYAPTNSVMIKLWLEEFTQAIQMGFLKYKKFIINEKINVSRLFNSDTDVYKTQHGCIQYILQKKIKHLPHIIFLNSLKSMLKLQLEECVTEENKKKYYKDNKNVNEAELKKIMIANCVNDKMINDKSVKKIPYIKLTRHDRKRDISKFFDD